LNEAIDNKEFSQFISDHECKGTLTKPHSFSHRVSLVLHYIK